MRGVGALRSLSRNNPGYPVPLSLLRSQQCKCLMHNRPLSKMGSTEQWPAKKVRETFIEFFEKNGHKFGKSMISR